VVSAKLFDPRSDSAPDGASLMSPQPTTAVAAEAIETNLRIAPIDETFLSFDLPPLSGDSMPHAMSCRAKRRPPRESRSVRGRRVRHEAWPYFFVCGLLIDVEMANAGLSAPCARVRRAHPPSESGWTPRIRWITRSKCFARGRTYPERWALRNFACRAIIERYVAY
jgi:hypothetical protein